MDVIYSTVFVCFFYYIAGNIFVNIRGNFSNTCITIVVGSIVLSFIGLSANFFVRLDLQNNTILTSIILLFFFYKRSFKTHIKLSLLFNLLLISFFSIIIIFLAESNRPDSGLYHYPFIKLINDEKIIFGITNINSRFGNISILQYLQAISNNYITGTNGMLLPSSIISSAIYLYFFKEIFVSIRKNKKNKIYLLYNFFSLVFFTFKMNRYGEYGNDYIPHFLVFLLFSLILKYKDRFSFTNSYFLSIFIFTNKITFLPVLIFPFIKIIKNKNLIKFINLKNIFITTLLGLWLIKGIVNSACLIWPIEKTCIKNLSWFNKDIKSIQHVNKMSKISQAWSKGWPENKDKNIDIENYISGFDWTKVWVSGHGKKILKIITIYLSILIFLAIVLKKNDQRKNPWFNVSSNLNLYLYLLIFFISICVWFLKFPVFRFGISYIINFFIIIFLILLSRTNLNKKNLKFIKNFSLICILVFVSKNMLKFENFNLKYDNFPWPRYYNFNKMNTQISLSEVEIDNQKSHYYTKDLCMYSKSPCTNEKVSNLLSISSKFKYKIYHFK